MGLGRWKAGGGIEEKANDLIWFWFEEFGYSPGFDAVEFIVQLFGLEGGWFQCAPPSSTRRHCWFLVSFVHIFQTVPADGALCFFWSLRDPSSQTSIWTCWPVGIPWTYLFEREIPIPLLFCLFFVFQDFWPSIQSRLLFFFFFFSTLDKGYAWLPLVTGQKEWSPKIQASSLLSPTAQLTSISLSCLLIFHVHVWEVGVHCRFIFLN